MFKPVRHEVGDTVFSHTGNGKPLMSGVVSKVAQHGTKRMYRVAWENGNDEKTGRMCSTLNLMQSAECPECAGSECSTCGGRGRVAVPPVPIAPTGGW